MMIRNATSGKTLAGSSAVLTTTIGHAIGLMFSRRIQDRGLVMAFETERLVPLHMLFVFYSIDVLWLDSRKKVVDMKENFRPFTFATPSAASRYVVELPEGTIKTSGTKIGDAIEF